MDGRPPPPGEGETPLVVNRLTPAGGINTVTAAVNNTNQLSTQHNNNSSALSAIDTSSSTAALSSIKPRRIANSLNEENQPPSTHHLIS